MKIEIYVKNKKSTISISKRSLLINDIIKKLDLNPDMYIVIKNNKIVPIDEPISDRDVLKFLPVASGG